MYKHEVTTYCSEFKFYSMSRDLFELIYSINLCTIQFIFRIINNDLMFHKILFIE